MTNVVSLIFTTILWQVTIQQNNEDWVVFENYRYFFSSDLANWDDANRSCHELESNLSSISNAGENMFINGVLEQLQTSNTTHYWIGLQHTSNSGCSCDNVTRDVSVSRQYCADNIHPCCTCRLRWIWTDSTEMNYFNWMYNEPTGGQRCARISRPRATHHTSGLFWFDFQCSNRSNFICKAPESQANSDDSNDDNRSGNKSKANDATNTVIGVSVGVTVIAISVVTALLIVVLAIRRNTRNRTKKHREDHVYYNEGKAYPAQSDEEQSNSKGNTHASADKAPNTHSTGTAYAEIIIPHATPKPAIDSKPKLVRDKVIQYAEIDLSPSNTPFTNNTDGNQNNEYASIDTGDVMRTVSYKAHEEYADVEGSSSNSPDTQQALSSVLGLQASGTDVQPVYAQPMKKKTTEPSSNIKHVPAPNDTGVLYAVPVK